MRERSLDELNERPSKIGAEELFEVIIEQHLKEQRELKKQRSAEEK